MPKNVKRIIRERGVKIILTAHDAEYYWNYKNLLAFYSKSKRKIICESKINSIKRGFLHEIGHSVDHALGWPSKKSEWFDIYKEERGRIKGYNYSNNVEFFADMFQLFMVSRYEADAMKDMNKFPKAKKYIDDLFEITESLSSAIDIKRHKPGMLLAE